jgi:Ca-activated chloride channel family protein
VTETRSWGRERGAAKTLALPVLLLIFLGGPAGPQVPPSGKGPDSGSYRISVDVDLVVLHASVRDRQGRFVPSLREGDFEVYEDGVRQSLRLFRHEDTPVTVGLVVDHSGSMRPKLADVITAARIFARSSNPEDQMFVVNFNEHVTLGLPGAMFTNRSEELERAISSAPAAGQTALYDAVVKAFERLQEGSRDKRVLLIISDGGDNASANSLAHVLHMVEQSNAIVYTIGIFEEGAPDANPKVLRRLAETTGGEAFFPHQLSEVVALCDRIAQDIRNQYTIGYVSTNAARDGAYRKIRVVARAASHSRLLVRTRAGYRAGGEARARQEESVK